MNRRGGNSMNGNSFANGNTYGNGPGYHQPRGDVTLAAEATHWELQGAW